MPTNSSYPTTGMYVLQGVDPAKVAAAPFDVKVIDIYKSSGQPFSAAEVAQMGGGPGKALLLGYFSLGEAETYRDYFKTIPASAIGPENPQWKGNFEVKFWTPEWKAVATAYIDKMLAAGYDGVYFDVVDEYQTAWAKANAPGGAAGAEKAMVDLVKYLGDYAEAKKPGFKVWVNNAEELLTNQTYLNSIDGMFKENLFYTDGGAKQSASDTNWSLSLLNKALAAGKEVVSIEYITGASKIADVHAMADKAGISSYVADLDLDGVNLSGVRPGQIMHDDNLGAPPLTVPNGLTSQWHSLMNTHVGTKGNDQLKGTSKSDVMAGLAGNDRLEGKRGADVLKGGKGHDVLIGGAGSDILSGGSGKDIFVFAKASDVRNDVITDFRKGDRIDLSQIDANTKVAGNQAFSLIGEKAFTGKAGQLASYKAGGDTYVVGDTNGDKVADFTLKLLGTHNFTKGDFIL